MSAWPAQALSARFTRAYRQVPGVELVGVADPVDAKAAALAKETGCKPFHFAPTGEQIGFIQTPEIAGNCTFGGPDLRTLYIAASTSLYRIRPAIPGLLTYPVRL